MPVDEQHPSDATAATEAMTRAAAGRLHAALNAHDLEGVRQLLAEDCVFESTSPRRANTTSAATPSAAPGGDRAAAFGSQVRHRGATMSDFPMAAPRR